MAAPLLARLRGRALVVGTDGVHVGVLRVPTLGHCTVEALPGGWLLRLADEPIAAVLWSLVLDLRDLRDTARVHVTGANCAWSHPLTPRHAEILLALAHYRRYAPPPSWPATCSATTPGP